MNPGISFYQRREELLETLGSVVVPPSEFLEPREKGEQDPEVDNGYVAVHYIDVGQGDCTVIVLPDTTVIMIDMGSKKDRKELGNIPFIQIECILNELNKKEIDYLLITHPDGDHYNMLVEFLSYAKQYIDKNFIYNKIYIGDRTVKYKENNTYKKLNLNVLKNQEYNKLVSGDWVFEILTANTFTGSNSSSIVSRLTYSGVSLYFMGDAESNVEHYIVNNKQKTSSSVNVLKLGHHGSKAATSMEWINWINPNIGFVSAGAKWQHPYQEPIQRFLDNDQRNAEYFEGGVGKHGWVVQNVNGIDRFGLQETDDPVFTNICYIQDVDSGETFKSLGTSYSIVINKNGFAIESWDNSAYSSNGMAVNLTDYPKSPKYKEMNYQKYLTMTEEEFDELSDKFENPNIVD